MVDWAAALLRGADQQLINQYRAHPMAAQWADVSPAISEVLGYLQ